MPRMDGQVLTVAVYPDPGDDRTVEDIGELLLDRGARADGDGFFVERHRRMLITRVRDAAGEDTPPVEIIMSAGPLGDPGYPRREMVTFARHLTGLLVAVAERIRPLYGGIAVEDIFPTPAYLRDNLYRTAIPSDPLFVRRDLLARSDLGAVLTGEYRRATENAAGTVFAAWWPYLDGSPKDPSRDWDTGDGGRLLGRVAARYLLERERADLNERP